ncbi:hypothetical protein [Paraurantiacibacter namhicola]|uniref:Alpha/beta hydrolase family protein n=1 Tax=Paraurantiacibacter namhicola TaxID=645517 RepID=A0A1C7D7H2_9SPHN|nr:hypothetical protein [Paraurantiacibacter namhicola]ANU07253.1 hypothetical protein A6F65_00943 [Paraurantiacibacter namhicola]
MGSLLRPLCLILAVFVSACGLPRHVEYAKPAFLEGYANTTRLFVDARGDLYPASGIPKGGFKLGDYDGSLQAAFADTAKGPCPSEPDASLAGRLCRAAPDDALWREEQAAQWQAAAKGIAAQYAAQGRKMPSTIFVIVHGFNNVEPEISPSYDRVKLAVMDRMADPRDVHFVEVYWDGCASNAVGLGCWGRAQATGPLVGFAMRPFFNALPLADKTKVRILAHSSGAFVLGATFGDPVAVLDLLQNPEKNADYARFEQQRQATTGDYRIPQLKDLRVGIMAAATAPATFTGIIDRGKGEIVFPGAGWLEKGSQILLSIQPDDAALNKGFVGCQRTGYSCLGARWTDACRVASDKGLKDREVEVRTYDFTRGQYPWSEDKRSHNFGIYVLQAARGSTFLQDLLADKLPAPGELVKDPCKMAA